VTERILFLKLWHCYVLCCYSLQWTTRWHWRPRQCGGVKPVNGIQTNQKSQRSLQLAEMSPGLTISSWDSPRVSNFRFLQWWHKALNICICTSLFTGSTFS